MTTEKLEKIYKAVGACPICGRTKLWLNDIPLKAFCWGTEENEHPVWTKKVPKKALK